MNSKIIKIFLLIIFFLSPCVSYAINIRQSGGMLYVEDTTTNELENLFTKFGYTRFHLLDDNAFPAIFVKNLPSDFRNNSSTKYRHELFIRILAPLALKINEEILNERNSLLRIERNYIKNKTITPKEMQKLETLAIKYDYFSRKKNDERIIGLINELKRRINIVPPSILIAAAAIESDWGESRIATEANSLYKEKVWYTNEGLAPLENKDEGYRFKIFDSLRESMESFALTFNSNIKYEVAWISREGILLRKDFIIGETIAYTLSMSSNLPNFAGILNYIAAFYDLLALDIGHLKKGLHYEP